MNSSFSDYVTLLTRFVEHHRHISEEIERRLLNVQGKPITQSRDRAQFDQAFNGCFFDPGVPRALVSLKGQLSAAQVADGFDAVLREGRAHQLDPLELVVRAYDYWERHRWPGRNRRLTYAQTLFSAYILRQLEHLSLRIWDDGTDRAAEHLQGVQHLLNQLNAVTGSPRFVRDARWLIQTAQGPLTRRLEPYFRIAERISRSLTASDRLEIYKAGARLAGGHLRSQLRYRASETAAAIDDSRVLAVTRNSNSMDGALLVCDLVSLLEAYEKACSEADQEQRLDLADAILQGLSADPELFLVRLDVLGPCTMLEEVFVERAPDRSLGYTVFGRSHLALEARFAELIGVLAPALKDDAAKLDPARAVYSPFAITYGFCADVLSNMALDTLHGQSSFDLSLEDMFRSGAQADHKYARARGWETLPKRDGEGEHFGHSIDWATTIFDRVLTALTARGLHGSRANASTVPTARLFAIPEGQPSKTISSHLPADAVSAQEHCVTSDLKRALASGAIAFPKSQILSDRKEGRYLASAESDGQWFGVSKVLLTACTCQGTTAVITGIPAAVIEILRFTCPDLVVVLED